MSTIPRLVARTLEEWGHSPPINRPDFTNNFLSTRLQATQVTGSEPGGRVVLSAVPNARNLDRIDSDAVDRWLTVENCSKYEPHGLWIPARSSDRGARRTSHGLLRFEFYDTWEKYLTVGYDGYLEYGVVAAREYERHTYYSYTPIAALIHRFVGFVLDFWQWVDDVPQYWIVASIPKTMGTSLWDFGDGWPDFRRIRFSGSSFPECLEDALQIARPLERTEAAATVGIWFATRIANAFGFNEPRCYIRSEGTIKPGQFSGNYEL